MNKTILIFLGLFILGFTFILSHVPGGATLATLSALTLTILAIINYVKSANKKDSSFDFRLFQLGLVLWLDYFLSKIQFWGISIYLIYLCVGLSIYLIFKLRTIDKLLNPKMMVLVLLIVCGVFISHVQSYSIYRLVKMNTLFNKNIRAYQYDKYSYFLFIGGKTNEAITAGEKAIKQSVIENGENSDLTLKLKEKLEQRKNHIFEF